MFLFPLWEIRTLKCEVVNFLKFKLTGVPIRWFIYLSVPILFVAHVPCTHVLNVHAHHDVTRFTGDVNHITMMSAAFAFHSCHVGMRWHDVIGVQVVGAPCHHASHHMGMT